jgi:hypothetical protein
MNYWKLSETGNMITYFMIVDGSIGEVEIDKYSSKQIDKITKRDLFKLIPISYIHYVQKEEGNSLLTISYGKDSHMYYKFENIQQIEDVAAKIASSGKVIDVTIGEDPIFTIVKKPAIALLTLLLFFSWSYLTAIELESGHGGGEHLVIILLVASLGTTYLPIIFGLLLCVIVYRIYYLLNRLVLT